MKLAEVRFGALNCDASPLLRLGYEIEELMDRVRDRFRVITPLPRKVAGPYERCDLAVMNLDHDAPKLVTAPRPRARHAHRTGRRGFLGRHFCHRLTTQPP